MKVLPSIAFNDFSGSANDVTARSLGGRIILSTRAKPSAVVTPAQSLTRNAFAKISKTFRTLTAAQMAAWENLAQNTYSQSVLGQKVTLTAYNLFMRLNANRHTAGEAILMDAPESVVAIGGVAISDFWITPNVICFTGIESPSSNLKLVVKLSAGLSSGVTNGWSRTVIVAPGIIPN